MSQWQQHMLRRQRASTAGSWGTDCAEASPLQAKRGSPNAWRTLQVKQCVRRLVMRTPRLCCGSVVKPAPRAEPRGNEHTLCINNTRRSLAATLGSFPSAQGLENIRRISFGCRIPLIYARNVTAPRDSHRKNLKLVDRKTQTDRKTMSSNKRENVWRRLSEEPLETKAPLTPPTLSWKSIWTYPSRFQSICVLPESGVAKLRIWEYNYSGRTLVLVVSPDSHVVSYRASRPLFRWRAQNERK